MLWDLNFPGTHWESNFSDDEYEQTVLNLFDQCNFHQLLDIPTCGNNTLDVLFTRNFPPINFDYALLYESVYNISDHRAVSLSFSASIPALKPVIEWCYSYNKADYTAIRYFMLENPFEPVCYTNADIATANWYKYINDIIHQFVPRRTYHRQSLPPWVSSSTSHLMKILQTKRKQYKENPSDFRRNNMQQTERKLTIALESDRSSYLEKLSHTRDTHTLFKFFKNLNQSAQCLQKSAMVAKQLYQM